MEMGGEDFFPHPAKAVTSIAPAIIMSNCMRMSAYL